MVAPPVKRPKTEHEEAVGINALSWDYPVTLIGEKVNDPDLINCCQICSLPILNYGRMIPCKHAFCTDCAQKNSKICSRCGDACTRVEECSLGTVFVCSHGGPRHGSEGCKRTYLSFRDMEAHVKHRHRKAEKKVTAPVSQPLPDLSQPPPAPYHHGRMPPAGHPPQGPPPHIRPPPRSGPPSSMSHGNLISIPIQGEPGQPEFHEFSGWRGQYSSHSNHRGGGWQGHGRGHRGMAPHRHAHPRHYQ